MNSDPTLAAWHKAIIKAASEKLKRVLTDQERQFITRRGSFIALEMISDTVNASSSKEVERYLNSE